MNGPLLYAIKVHDLSWSFNRNDLIGVNGLCVIAERNNASLNKSFDVNRAVHLYINTLSFCQLWKKRPQSSSQQKCKNQRLLCSNTISTKLLLFVQNLLLVVDKNCCLLYTLFSCQKCEQVKKHETFCGCCENHSVGNMQPQVSIVWYNRNMSFGPPWRSKISFITSKASWKLQFQMGTCLIPGQNTFKS